MVRSSRFINEASPTKRYPNASMFVHVGQCTGKDGKKKPCSVNIAMCEPVDWHTGDRTAGLQTPKTSGQNLYL